MFGSRTTCVDPTNRSRLPGNSGNEWQFRKGALDGAGIHTSGKKLPSISHITYSFLTHSRSCCPWKWTIFKSFFNLYHVDIVIICSYGAKIICSSYFFCTIPQISNCKSLSLWKSYKWLCNSFGLRWGKKNNPGPNSCFFCHKFV